jgi:CRP-like cAMP-binding protein
VISDALRRVGIFADLEAPVLERMASRCREVQLPSDGFAYRHGDDGDALFVVVSGRLVAFRDAVGKPMQLLHRHETGDFFGEMCVFEEYRRDSSVRADEPSRLLRLDKRDLVELLEAHPRLALRLHVAAAKRRSLEAAAALELGRRCDVRIRLGMMVRFEHAADRSVSAPSPSPQMVPLVLENLSVGGMCLGSAPSSWTVDQPLRGTLVVGAVRLPVGGRVAWARGRTIGVSFDERPPTHEMLVFRVLRQLAEDGVEAPRSAARGDR